MSARHGHGGGAVRRAQAWRGNLARARHTDLRRGLRQPAQAACGMTVPSLGGLTGCVLDVGHLGDCQGGAA